MLDLIIWSTSAIASLFTVSFVNVAGAQDAASLAREEPVNFGVTVQLKSFIIEPAAKVEEEESTEKVITSNSLKPETVSDTDTSWKELLKEDIELQELALCESGNNPRAINRGDAEITGYSSYGLFQFQPGTFTGYVQKYEMLPGVPKDQILDYIYDPTIQIELVKKMLHDGLGKSWKTCYYRSYGDGSHRAASK